MPVHLQREIDKLKKQILSLCAITEENVRRAVESFTGRNVELAAKVISTDEEIDHAEVDVEEECLKILALHQPVAVDLRYIIAMLKINHDLERIGDHAVNMAEYAILQASHPPLPAAFDFDDLPGKVEAMLQASLDALMELDVELARNVWRSDDAIDAINRQMFQQAEQIIAAHPEHWRTVLLCLSVSRVLERIADHAANIAKDVIYLVEGEIVRHRGREFKQTSSS